ncbi:MAG TPA: rhodanese-like domain-containing protein [Xanthobacteraceae bacterium]|nr:rhodanese-like domain-containing protein [Xanthobacteraceae bacterium]
MNTSISTTIEPETAAAWLAKGDAVLIDVREPDEFGREHIAAAISIPLNTLVATLAALPLPPQRKLIFQCLKGGRGEQARLAAAQAGRESYNLAGGILGWKQAGLPVSVAAGPVSSAGVPPIFRQVQIAVGLLVVSAVLVGFTGHPAGFIMAGLFGAALAVAGGTGWCGLAIVLGRMPWNRPA